MASRTDGFHARVRAPPAQWVTQRERGSITLLRAMSRVSLRLGRPASRCILYVVAAYYFAFAPTARRHARDYLRRALGREPAARDRFRHLMSFATTIHDRVFLGNGRFDIFDISIEGEELVLELLRAGNGAFLMGAHVGSFEVTSAIGRRQPGLRVLMAMYEENARKVATALAAINPAAKPEIIALGQMDAMLKIREYLDRGAFVGVLGDRSLGDEPGQMQQFLGDPARFPVGAMRVAALLRRRVIFMAGLYRGGNRYHIVFEQIADFSVTPANQRAAEIEEAVARYAKVLEKICRSHPYNWFNFHDFWRGVDNSSAGNRP